MSELEGESGGSEEVDLGYIAYTGYCAASGGKSLITGEPLPEYEDQAEPVKQAWRESGGQVAEWVTDFGAFVQALNDASHLRALLDHETRLTWETGLERERVAGVRETAGLPAVGDA